MSQSSVNQYSPPAELKNVFKGQGHTINILHVDVYPSVNYNWREVQDPNIDKYKHY